MGDITNDVWSIASLSSGIASGTHVMEFNTPIYDAYGWDGWLLYDGDITSAGSPTTNPVTYGEEYTVYWTDPSTIQPNSWPTISAPSVTPNFTVTGIDSGESTTGSNLTEQSARMCRERRSLCPASIESGPKHGRQRPPL